MTIFMLVTLTRLKINGVIRVTYDVIESRPTELKSVGLTTVNKMSQGSYCIAKDLYIVYL